jgi:hypothetical protein
MSALILNGLEAYLADAHDGGRWQSARVRRTSANRHHWSTDANT